MPRGGCHYRGPALNLHDLEVFAKAVGQAMVMKGYPGFTLDVYVPRPEGMARPEHEVRTLGGLIRFHAYESAGYEPRKKA